MGAPSRDFRHYYNGKEGYRPSWMRGSIVRKSNRQRTRGEKVADAVGRVLMVVVLIASDRAPTWATMLAFAAFVIAAAAEWWLGRRDERRIREAAAS